MVSSWPSPHAVKIAVNSAYRQIRSLSQQACRQPVSPLAFDLHEPRNPVVANKAPIIFLHGLFGSKKNNRGISKALARDLMTPVYALDLRNHGESPHDPCHDYEAMAEDVFNFIEEQSLKKPIIIGHSMGAKTAMTLALRSPATITSIISVDNAPVDVALSRKFASYVRGMKKIQQAKVERQVEADKILQEFEESLPIRQFLLGNLHRSGDGVQIFRIPLDILGRSLDHLGDFPYKNPDQRRYTNRSLFIRGTRSGYIPDDALPLIGRFFPQFRLVDVDAGHWLISEEPEIFRQAVVDFLQDSE